MYKLYIVIYFNKMFYFWKNMYLHDIQELENEIKEYKKDIRKNKLESCNIISSGLSYLQNILLEKYQILHKIERNPNSKDSLETMGMYMYDVSCKKDRKIYTLQKRNTLLEYKLYIPSILLKYTPLPKDCIDIIMNFALV